MLRVCRSGAGRTFCRADPAGAKDTMPSGRVAALDAVEISISAYTLLRDISLVLQSGSLCVIGGPGGCGKSSILRVFWGALRPVKGAIFCGGRDFTHASSRQWAAWRQRLGIVGDDFPLLNEWTVFANVAAALRVAGGLPKEAVVSRTNRELGKWKLLHKRHLPAHLLAGDERARLALARAFVRRPVAAFLDEPLANIPAGERDEMCAKIHQEAISGTAVLVATTAGESRALSADEVYLTEGGQLRLHRVG